jgi:hypothetical protein
LLPDDLLPRERDGRSESLSLDEPDERLLPDPLPAERDLLPDDLLPRERDGRSESLSLDEPDERLLPDPLPSERDSPSDDDRLDDALEPDPPPDEDPLEPDPPPDEDPLDDAPRESDSLSPPERPAPWRRMYSLVW